MRRMVGSGLGRWLGVALVGLAALCAAPGEARAEDGAKADALATAAAGRAKQGETRVAIDLYDEAYAAAPRREYLRAIGALYDNLALGGDSRDVRLAIVYYERFLTGEGLTDARAAVEGRLTVLRQWKANMRAEPQPPPPPRAVPVHLLAYRGEDSYEATLGSASCVTPCTIMAPPGPTALETKGSGELKLQVVVPPRPSRIRLHHTESSAFTAGAVLLPVGITMGASMWALAFTCSNFNDSCVAGNLIAWPVIGGSMMITGIVLLARGRVTPPVDANRVELRRPRRRAPPPHLVRPRPDPRGRWGRRAALRVLESRALRAVALAAARAPGQGERMRSLRLAWLPCVAALFACPGEAVTAPRFVMGPSAGLRANLGPEGVAVGPVAARPQDAWAWEATPARWGCEGDLEALPRVAPRVAGGRVEYPREGLTEWYVESPRGLEQGFTLPRAPACRDRGGDGVVIELTGGRGGTGGVDATIAPGGRTAVLRDAAGHEVMRYAELSVIDAAGRDLPAELVAGPGGLSIRFDDRGAAYPVTVDPLMWVQQGKLTASDTTGMDNFGWAVALSGDTAVLGAPDKSAGIGAAYVFARSCGAWSQPQELDPADDVPGQGFGAAVAIDADTLMVGAQAANSYKGAVYVFTRSGSSWSQAQVLTASDGQPGDQFGAAVAVQGDTAIVGASAQNGAQGGVYVFTRSGSTWSQAAESSPAGGASGDQIGSSVALDGSTAIIGAPGTDGQRGAAYVFVGEGSTWSSKTKLVASDAAPGDQLGSAVAVSGSTALLGAYDRNSATGAAYVFTGSGSSWAQQKELLAQDATSGDRFGWTLAITGDTAIVGAPLKAASQGAAYVFARSGGTWSLAQTLTAADGATGDSFGYGMAISGTTTLVGALSSPTGQGAAYVFVNDGADAGTDVNCGSGAGGAGSGAGAGGGSTSNASSSGAGASSAMDAHDLKDHIPFAFGGCGCRVADAGDGGLGALAVGALAAGLATQRRRRR